MISKSSRSLNIRRDSLGLQTPHRRRKVKVASKRRTIGRKTMENLRTTNPNRKKIRTMGRQRKTLGNGASFISSLGITSLNSSQRSHWWLM
jgi:hypothetical protein